jgi:hypothetical protein
VGSVNDLVLQQIVRLTMTDLSLFMSLSAAAQQHLDGCS